MAPYTSPEPPLRLSFGIELEFVCRYNREDYAEAYAIGDEMLWDPNSFQYAESTYERLVQSHMVGLLYSKGIPVNKGIGPYDSEEMLRDSIDRWTVSDDCTIRDPGGNGEYYGVEVKTPAFLFCDESIEQVEKVVGILNANFDLHVNDTCGMHVHIGNAGEKYPFTALKNFLMFVSLFEQQISSIHSEKRCLDNHYIQTIGEAAWYKRSPGEIAEIIANEISSITDIVEKVQCSGRFTTYNFSPLREYTCSNSRPPRTIEFRQHAGTLDSDEILSWVHFCLGLVGEAHAAGPKGFASLIVKRMHNAKTFSLLDLLQGLGMEGAYAFFEEKGLHQHPKWHWEWRSSVVTNRNSDLEDQAWRDTMTSFGLSPTAAKRGFEEVLASPVVTALERTRSWKPGAPAVLKEAGDIYQRPGMAW